MRKQIFLISLLAVVLGFSGCGTIDINEPIDENMFKGTTWVNNITEYPDYDVTLVMKLKANGKCTIICKNTKTNSVYDRINCDYTVKRRGNKNYDFSIMLSNYVVMAKDFHMQNSLAIKCAADEENYIYMSQGLNPKDDGKVLYLSPGIGYIKYPSKETKMFYNAWFKQQ